MLTTARFLVKWRRELYVQAFCYAFVAGYLIL